MSERRDSEAELIERIRSIDVPAPRSLHESVHALLAEHAGGRARRGRLSGALAALLARPRLVAGGALAAAALAVALALGLSGGGTPAPSLRQTAALTLGAATAGAPRESGNHASLTASVDGIFFPYWQDRLRWRSTGQRTDRIAGRTITTVFYADARGREVGYAIVSGVPAPPRPDGATVLRDHVPYRVVNINGTPVISWIRSGHLCVLSGRGIDAATLVHLASWDARDSLA
jgi:hypothetical protein